MLYTADDVRKAVSAKIILAEAETEECSPEEIIRSLYDEEENPGIVAREIAWHKEGEDILKEARLLQAQHRTTVGRFSNGEIYHDFPDADSPTVLIDAGWIATSQAWRAYALKKR